MPSTTRILLNPVAGPTTDLEANVRTMLELLPDAEIIRGTQPGHLKVLASEAVADGCTRIVAAGGDGTLNEVINGVGAALDRVEIGLLPLGTGNDFARSLGIPVDLPHALAVLLEARSVRLDIIRVTRGETRRLMVNVSAGGLSSFVSERTTEDVKNSWGRLGYAKALLESLPDLSDFKTSILLDGDGPLETPAYNIVVANGRFVAGGVPIAPAAQLSDGLVDVVIIPPATVPELAVLGPTTLLGRHLDSDHIIFRKARRVEIRSEPAMRFNVDGELLPAGTIAFEVMPRALRFIAGPAFREE